MLAIYGLSEGLYDATRVPVSVRLSKHVKWLDCKGLRSKRLRGPAAIVSFLVHTGDSRSAPRTRSVAARPRGRRLEPLRALVAEEVVAADEVVHLQAIGARVPLADVALEERFVRDEGAPLLVVEERLARRAAAGLAGGGHLWTDVKRYYTRPGRGIPAASGTYNPLNA